MNRDLSALAERIGTLVREVRVQLEVRISEQVARLEGLIRAVPAGPQGPSGEPGVNGRDGAKGKDGEPGPRGETGERGTNGDPGPAGLEGQQGPAGQDGEDGKDGKDGKDGIPGPQGDRGDTGPVGPAGERGMDGAPGRDAVLPDLEPIVQRVFEAGFAKWAVDIERRAHDVFQRAIDKMPLPKDGKDGFGFEDLSVFDDGHGNATLTFKRGELSRSFNLRIPCNEYFGVWREGQSYTRGNLVTWAGSVWHCSAETTTQKPGSGSQDWQLAVKRGEDGRAGLNGKDGERGPQGPAGRDLTPFGFDGGKR